MSIDESVMYAKPEALIIQCRTPMGTLLVSWEQDADSGEWQSMVTAIRHDLDGVQSVCQDRIPAGEMFGQEEDRPEADSIVEAAVRMSALAISLDNDYEAMFDEAV